MVWGEAGAALVLQTQPNQDCYEHYCRLAGSATTCNTALSPSGFVDPDMIQKAAEQALDAANIRPEQLAVCHPHGMGNPPSDLPELAGLLQVLAADSRPHPLVLVGHKASLGHSVCAAGLISV
ncbi:MAG: hypothetical protein VXZ35_14420, partial [Pseudomonadota bacterium]|nr:hypothetical protein [Pseudomonadota bacterium]